MALRAGAVAADLEFYQFHPTSLDAPGNFLVSEAVRGEGATLIDADGKRFMLDVHPDAELAPRDVVARGIAAQMAKQPGIPVRLDATALGAEFLAKRFPNIDAACRAQGFDWGEVPIPVTPGGALLHGRHPHRRVGTHLDPRALRRRRGRLQRPARRQPARVQLAARGRGLRHAGHRGARRPGATSTRSTPTGRRRSRSTSPTTPTATTSTAATCSSSCGTPPGWRATATTSSGPSPSSAGGRRRTVTDAKSAEDANLLVVARAVVASALARQRVARRALPHRLPRQRSRAGRRTPSIAAVASDA